MEVDNSAYLDSVLYQLKKFLSKYDVKNIYAWGNCDKDNLEYALSLTRNKRKNLYNIVSSIKDLQPEISKYIVKPDGELDRKTWGLLKAIKVYNSYLPTGVAVNGQTHNALADAENLAALYKLCQKHGTVVLTDKIRESIKTSKVDRENKQNSQILQIS